MGLARTSGHRLYYGWYVVGAWRSRSRRRCSASGPGRSGVVVGRLIDRCGPRPVLVGGAMLLSGGALALGLIRQLWQLYLSWLALIERQAHNDAPPLAHIDCN